MSAPEVFPGCFLAAPGRKFHSEEAFARVILGEYLKSGRLTDLLTRESEGA
jgi:hypothetical protein